MRVARLLLGLCVLILLAVGFVLLASASGKNGLRLYNNSYHFVIRQAIWLVPAGVAFLCAWFFDYHGWRKFPTLTISMYLIVVVLMVIVLFCPEVNGSRRWIPLPGGVKFQPSEFAKITVLLATAVVVDNLGWKIELFWKGTFLASLVVGIPTILAAAEPDYGTTCVIATIGGVLLFLGGIKWRWIIMLTTLSIGSIGMLVWLTPNRVRRLLAFLHREGDADHQLNAALVAINRGGINGVGFNESIQKEHYLPEAHTDFIFAIGAEELGIVFSVVLLLLFLIVFICGLYISAHAPDRFGHLIAYAAVFIIFVQALANVGVVSGCLPTKGLALPFISYGGTSLVSSFTAIGLLFNIVRQSLLQKSRSKSKIPLVFS